jgi:hypothetical protein
MRTSLFFQNRITKKASKLEMGFVTHTPINPNSEGGKGSKDIKS